MAVFLLRSPIDQKNNERTTYRVDAVQSRRFAQVISAAMTKNCRGGPHARSAPHQHLSISTAASRQDGILNLRWNNPSHKRKHLSKHNYLRSSLGQCRSLRVNKS